MPKRFPPCQVLAGHAPMAACCWAMATELGTAEVLAKVVERLERIDERLGNLEHGQQDLAADVQVVKADMGALRGQVAEVRVAQRSTNARLEAVEGHVDEILETLHKQGDILLKVHSRTGDIRQSIEEHGRRLDELEASPK